MFDIVLYTIWIAFPVFFFTLALWHKLEVIGGKGRNEEVRDFLSQGVFVSFCVVLAYLVDKFALESIVSFVPPDLIPLNFFRVILLPFIFLLGAKVVGPSKEIRILRAPKPTENRSKRRR